LVADYSSDSRARTAFEVAARQDASRLVRMAAERPLYGDAQWQSYVVATLGDKGLGSAERLAPAIHEMWQYPGGLEKLQSYMGTPEVTTELLGIFEELRPGTRQAATAAVPAGVPSALAARLAEFGVPPERMGDVALQVSESPAGVPGEPVSGSGAVSNREIEAMQVVSILAIANPPAAIDLQIRILTEDPQPGSLTMSALNALIDERDDPRVSKVLDDIAAGNSGAQLRTMLERNLALRPQTDPPSIP
jgi:hypothetical protein